MKRVYNEAYRDDTYPMPAWKPAMGVGPKKVGLTVHWKVFDDVCLPVRVGITTVFHGLNEDLIDHTTRLEDLL